MTERNDQKSDIIDMSNIYNNNIGGSTETQSSEMTAGRTLDFFFSKSNESIQESFEFHDSQGTVTYAISLSFFGKFSFNVTKGVFEPEEFFHLLNINSVRIEDDCLVIVYNEKTISISLEYKNFVQTIYRNLRYIRAIYGSDCMFSELEKRTDLFPKLVLDISLAQEFQLAYYANCTQMNLNYNHNIVLYFQQICESGNSIFDSSRLPSDAADSIQAFLEPLLMFRNIKCLILNNINVQSILFHLSKSLLSSHDEIYFLHISNIRVSNDGLYELVHTFKKKHLKNLNYVEFLNLNSQLDSLANLISSLPLNLYHIGFSSLSSTETFTSNLFKNESLRGLRSLRLISCVFTPDSFTDLNAYFSLDSNRLTHVDFSSNSDYLFDLLVVLEKCRYLESITLKECEFSNDSSLQLIKVLEKNRNVTNLDISFSTFIEDKISDIITKYAGCCSGSLSIIIDGVVKDDKMIIPIMSGFLNISNFDLWNHISISDFIIDIRSQECFAALLSRMPNIITVNISNIRNSSLLVYNCLSLKCIKNIYASNTINSKDLSEFKLIIKGLTLTNADFVDLSSNNLNDDQIVEIFSIFRSNDNLKGVKVSFNDISRIETFEYIYSVCKFNKSIIYNPFDGYERNISDKDNLQYIYFIRISNIIDSHRADFKLYAQRTNDLDIPDIDEITRKTCDFISTLQIDKHSCSLNDIGLKSPLLSGKWECQINEPYNDYQLSSDGSYIRHNSIDMSQPRALAKMEHNTQKFDGSFSKSDESVDKQKSTNDDFEETLIEKHNETMESNSGTSEDVLVQKIFSRVMEKMNPIIAQQQLMLNESAKNINGGFTDSVGNSAHEKIMTDSIDIEPIRIAASADSRHSGELNEFKQMNSTNNKDFNSIEFSFTDKSLDDIVFNPKVTYSTDDKDKYHGTVIRKTKVTNFDQSDVKSGVITKREIDELLREVETHVHDLSTGGAENSNHKIATNEPATDTNKGSIDLVRGTMSEETTTSYSYSSSSNYLDNQNKAESKTIASESNIIDKEHSSSSSNSEEKIELVTRKQKELSNKQPIKPECEKSISSPTVVNSSNYHDLKGISDKLMQKIEDIMDSDIYSSEIDIELGKTSDIALNNQSMNNINSDHDYKGVTISYKNNENIAESLFKNPSDSYESDEEFFHIKKHKNIVLSSSSSDSIEDIISSRVENNSTTSLTRKIESKLSAQKFTNTESETEDNECIPLSNNPDDNYNVSDAKYVDIKSCDTRKSSESVNYNLSCGDSNNFRKVDPPKKKKNAIGSMFNDDLPEIMTNNSGSERKKIKPPSSFGSLDYEVISSSKKPQKSITDSLNDKHKERTRIDLRNRKKVTATGDLLEKIFNPPFFNE